MKIWIFQSSGASTYNVLNHFSESFVRALVRQGVEVRVFRDVMPPFAHFDADFVVTFFGYNIPASRPMPWDIYKIPHVYLSVDTIDYFIHQAGSPYLILAVRDRAAYKILLEKGYRNTLFLPHAADQDFDMPSLTGPGTERPYEVSFLGSVPSHSIIVKSLKTFPLPFQDAMETILELLFSDVSTSYHEAYRIIAKKRQLPPLSFENETIYMKLIEMIARYRDRIELLKSIRRIPLHIFGGSFDNRPWKEVLQGQDNITFHPEITFAGALDVMKKSKITLNSSPTIKEGGHERLFYAYLCGSLPMTNENLFVNDWFQDGKNILTYRTDRRELAEEKIISFLRDEPRRIAAVEEGRAIVLSHHTWDNRAKELIAALKNYRRPC